MSSFFGDNSFYPVPLLSEIIDFGLRRRATETGCCDS
jgi:hypothetical protein